MTSLSKRCERSGRTVRRVVHEMLPCREGVREVVAVAGVGGRECEGEQQQQHSSSSGGCGGGDSSE